MTLHIRDIDFRTDVPKIPGTLPALRTSAPCASDRADAMRRLADVLGLVDAVEVALPFGHALATRDGQVEFFNASGAVRARDLTVTNRFQDERRDWRDVEPVPTREGVDYRLGPEAGRRLIDRSRSLLADVGLLADGADDVDVVLGRWAALDPKGEEIESGPGRATVQWSYSFDGIPFVGAGAKTNLHFDPVDGEPRLARLFHVHRFTDDARPVEVGDAERAFHALLADPFLVDRAGRGGRVAVTGLRLGLLALPADVPQRFAIPALQVDGVVEGLRDERKGEYELRFGRYVPAVTPEALRAAGIAVAEAVDTPKPEAA